MALTAMATEFTVFDGTATNQYVPVRSSYYDWSPYYSQVIYPADQLAELKGKGITSVKFYIANEAGNTMNGGGLGVYLGTTTQESFPSWNPSYVTGLTKVANISMTSGEKEIVINIDPWVYEGDNLVLQTAIEDEGSYSGETYFYGVAADSNCAVYGGSYTINGVAFYHKTTFTYEGDTPSAIDEVKATNAETSQRYNMMGQPVSKDYKGIVIENGKIIIVR